MVAETAAAATGLRERKKLETRTALRRAAVRLYLERGPSAVTVHDICEAVGISPRTFFNYFDTKDDAVFDWDHRLVGHLLELLAARPAEEAPLEALHRALRASIPPMVDDPGWRERRRLLAAHPELVPKLLHSNSHLADALAEGIAARTGLSPDSLYPRLVAGAGMTTVRTAIWSWDPDSPTEELLAMLDSCCEAFAAGLPEPADARGPGRIAAHGHKPTAARGPAPPGAPDGGTGAAADEQPDEPDEPDEADERADRRTDEQTGGESGGRAGQRPSSASPRS